MIGTFGFLGIDLAMFDDFMLIIEEHMVIPGYINDDATNMLYKLSLSRSVNIIYIYIYISCSTDMHVYIKTILIYIMYIMYSIVVNMLKPARTVLKTTARQGHKCSKSCCLAHGIAGHLRRPGRYTTWLWVVPVF